MRYLLAIIAAVFLSNIADAQLHVNFNVNLDRQPIWGPAGYDHAEYYYMPDIEVYYNVSQQRYFYQERGRWTSGASLPARYRGYDLYHSHKVVVNEPTPYLHHDMYRAKYASFRGVHDQKAIRDSREAKYFVNKNHPEHNNWVKEQKHDNGNGRGNGNNKDKDHGNKHGRE
jgi:hypothetical protein